MAQESSGNTITTNDFLNMMRSQSFRWWYAYSRRECSECSQSVHRIRGKASTARLWGKGRGEASSIRSTSALLTLRSIAPPPAGQAVTDGGPATTVARLRTTALRMTTAMQSETTRGALTQQVEIRSHGCDLHSGHGLRTDCAISTE